VSDVTMRGDFAGPKPHFDEKAHAAGTMAASGSGLQWGTIKNMCLAWIMTLPAAMSISGTLFMIPRQIF
jgi:hypothetical protein